MRHLKKISDFARATEWYEDYSIILRDHPKGVERVIRAGRYLARTTTAAKRLEPELLYFTRNRDRMCYAKIKAEGLPVGSGVVETANKTLVRQRMKRSGLVTGRAILTFRVLMKSGRLPGMWDILVEKHTEPGNDNTPADLAIAA